MQIKSKVNSAVPIKVPSTLKLEGGQTIQADVDMLAVELVTDDPGQKNPMFNMPADHADAFKPGTRVTITVEVESGK